jgi:hypothetical protein
MKAQEILKQKNVTQMRKLLNLNGIYNGGLSDKSLIENFEYYIQIGKIN